MVLVESYKIFILLGLIYCAFGGISLTLFGNDKISGMGLGLGFVIVGIIVGFFESGD